MEKLHLLGILSTLFHAFYSTNSQSYIGVNYGEVANNLPPASSTAGLLESTTISNLRLYNANPSIIRSLSNTNISLTISTANSDIPSLASSPSAASSWISSNLLPFLPSASISTVSVANELLTAADPTLSSLLLPAMQNLHSAIPTGINVKISTVHSMALLSQSDPPSSASFKPDLLPTLKPILQFLHDNNSPFMINPYPYFAYQADPRPETLAFCLFQPNPGRLDPASGTTYMNMFDAQVAAVRAALGAAGFAGMEVVVAETGWPYNGDAGEAGATVENARAYNGNLVAHLRAMPDPVRTFIFALYDEDLKPGPTSERSFGLYRTDLTPVYDAGLNKPEKLLPPSLSPTAEPPPPMEETPTPTGETPTPTGETPTPTEQIPAPPEACVQGRGGGTCGQPVAQNLPRNSEDNGAGVGPLGRVWKDTCWMARVLDFFFCVVSLVLVMR